MRLLFQPSEEQKDDEGWSGAMRMLEEGALDGVDAAISLHTRALPAGSIGVTSGPALAANDTITITVQGKAAHGARPHEGIDALAIAAQVIVAINHIVSRRVPAIEPGVISLTTINGGIKENILADRVTIGGTVRSTGGAAREHMFREIERALEVGRVLGATCSLHVKEGYPLLRNDAARHRRGARGRRLKRSARRRSSTCRTPRGPRISPTSRSACPPRCSGLASPRPAATTRSGIARRSRSTKDALPIGATVFAASVLRLLRSGLKGNAWRCLYGRSHSSRCAATKSSSFRCGYA